MVYFHMTEAEAKTKTCPHIMDHLLGSFRPMDCFASQCMAWRWAKEKDTRMIDDECTYVDVGYCGLSGKP